MAQTKTLANRLMWAILLAVMVIGPLWGNKTMINKEYLSKQSIIKYYTEGDAEFAFEGKRYTISPSEWQYLGMGDTDLRPTWSKGGYMVNLYGIAERDGKFFIIAVGVDDRAREIFREPWEIRKEKGVCRSVSYVEKEVVMEMYRSRKLGPLTEHVFNEGLCKANQNALEDTRWTWEWGSLHMSMGTKSVLEKSGEKL